MGGGPGIFGSGIIEGVARNGSGPGATTGRLARFVRESPLFDGWRPQRLRGPLDWQVNNRFYVWFGLVVLILPALGLQLLLTGRWWERLGGLVLFPAGSLLAVGLMQWLRRPVDPEEVEALHRRQAARGRFGGMKRRRPPRFPPGSANSTQLPPADPSEGPS